MKNILVIILVFTVLSCNENENKSNKLKVVTTTTMITDLVSIIGGDAIEVNGLMGAGVDPHLYKASEGDVTKLYEADIIFYNGLHLEGKLVDVFKKMKQKKQIALANKLPENRLIGSEYFASNYDPHVWFDISFFILFAEKVTKTLISEDPKNKLLYLENSKEFIRKLIDLEIELTQLIKKLPKENRILVTAHDAFNYFGASFGFQVVGLQGLSTATEAGVQDVQKLSEFIITNKIKAIFVESSVPKRTIEALIEAVNSKGHQVEIGGSLYSDALGNKGTYEGTYLGMYKHNVTTIVNALK
jgi:manganese/zinc/iron transport system substrate-binding protein